MAGYFSFLSCSSLRGVLFECLMKLSSKGWDPYEKHSDAQVRSRHKENNEFSK